MIDVVNAKPRYLCVGIAGALLDELSDLLAAAGAESGGEVVQNRKNPDPATYVGAGKLAEIRALAEENACTGICCDDELTPSQINNLTSALDLPVLDRTLVILDIFAARAHTREGKIQVELAQLKYRQAHLVGSSRYLSRQGGGIGTRGPGETKLETDRRQIGHRIATLTKELEKVKRHREVNRRNRERQGIPTVAVVGYTNAGKSTLLNLLTGSDVLAKDALFATLDPTTRRLYLPEAGTVLLTDTVGLVRKLPHDLVDAFRATLEEASLADVLVHVADAGSPAMEDEMKTVYQVLDDLGAGHKRVITLLNKQDLPNAKDYVRDPRAAAVIPFCARTGRGKEQLLSALTSVLLEVKDSR